MKNLNERNGVTGCRGNGVRSRPYTVTPSLRYPVTILLAAFALLHSLPSILSAATHDGGGNTILTAANIVAGDTYRHYVVRSAMNGPVLDGVTIDTCDIGNISGDNAIVPSRGANGFICTNNRFHDISGTGVFSAGDHVFAGCHFDYNTFKNVGEGIHLQFTNNPGSHDNTFNYNVIDTYVHCGIELQSVSFSGLEVLHNYIVNPGGNGSGGGNQGHMALSIATGDDSTLKAAPKTSGNEIGWNVCLGNASCMASGAIENYGSGANIHDNYVSQWNWGIVWNWTGLNGGNVPWHIANNTIIGCNIFNASEGYGTAAQNPPATLSGNQIFALGDPKAPSAPTAAATISPPAAPSGTGSANGQTQPGAGGAAVPLWTATAQTDGIHFDKLPSAGCTVTWSATGNTGVPLATASATSIPPTLHASTVPAGQTTFVDQSAPSNWQVLLTVSGAPGGELITTAAQVFPAPPSTQPATSPTTAPATQPAVTHHITVFRDGTESIDGGAAQ